HTDGVDIRTQHHVRIGGRERFIRIVCILAGYGEQKDARRNPERSIALALQELLRWKHLAANDAVQIRNQTFDFADAALLNPTRKTLIHTAPILSRAATRG